MINTLHTSFLETIGRVKCKVCHIKIMQMTMTIKGGTTLTLGWPLMDSDSLNELFDGRAPAFMKALKWRLMEAMSGHTDDKYHSREERLCLLSLLWSYGEFLFLQIGRRCLSSWDTRSTSLGSKLRDGNFDLFP